MCEPIGSRAGHGQIRDRGYVRFFILGACIETLVTYDKGLRRCSHCQELADLYTMLAQAKVALGDLAP